MKTFKVIVFILAMLIAEQTAAETRTMYVLCSPESMLMARSTPSKSGEEVGWFIAGDEVEIESVKRGWAKIKDASALLDTSSAYVSADYLSEYPVEVHADGARAKVDADGRVKLRRTPNGEQKGWARDGDGLTVYAVGGEWSVTDKGYIQTKYLLME